MSKESLPCTFSTLVLSMASSAVLAMGLDKNPQTGKIEKDMDVARFVVGDVAAAATPVPSVALELTLASPTPEQPLVSSSATGLQIGTAVLGGSLSAAGGAVVATLTDARASSGVSPATLTLPQALAQSTDMQLLERLLYALASAQAPQGRPRG